MGKVNLSQISRNKTCDSWLITLYKFLSLKGLVEDQFDTPLPCSFSKNVFFREMVNPVILGLVI